MAATQRHTPTNKIENTKHPKIQKQKKRKQYTEEKKKKKKSRQ
jgi:hypothetical protein